MAEQMDDEVTIEDQRDEARDERDDALVDLAAARAEVERLKAELTLTTSAVLRWGTDSASKALHERHGEIVTARFMAGLQCADSPELHVVRLALEFQEAWERAEMANETWDRLCAQLDAVTAERDALAEDKDVKLTEFWRTAALAWVEWADPIVEEAGRGVPNGRHGHEGLRAQIGAMLTERDALAAATTQYEYAMRVLRLSSLDCHDDCSSFFWRCDGEYAPITFMVLCSDTFAYACADAETVTPENLGILEQAYIDAAAASPRHGPIYATILFVARVRKMKPMPAVLQHLEPALVALFDALSPPDDDAPADGSGKP